MSSKLSSPPNKNHCQNHCVSTQEQDSQYITEAERQDFAQNVKGYLPKNYLHDKDAQSPNQRRPRSPFAANLELDVDLKKDPHQDDTFKRAGLKTSIMSKLISGKIKPQMTLDLHGLQVAEAGRALTDAINDAYQNSCECVIVIHGKGSTTTYNNYEMSGHRFGKLKSYVMAWLKDNSMILGFCRAPRQDGGSGATYILLSKS